MDRHVTEKEGRALDVQVGGNHYKSLKIQPIEYTMANNLGYCEGNIIKYVTRHTSKNGKEDLLKAKHYIDLLIDQKYPEETGMAEKGTRKTQEPERDTSSGTWRCFCSHFNGLGSANCSSCGRSYKERTLRAW